MIDLPNPPYRPISQQPYCCVPATLQWILYRHGLDILDQESIGAELGLRLPTKGKKLFKNRHIIFLDKTPKSGFGTQIQKKKYSIQRFFEKNGIALEISELIKPQTKAELRKILVENHKKDHDVILRYNNRIFKKDDEKSYGHFSVITKYDSRSERVTIGDPELPHFKTVSLDQVLFSISDKIDGIGRGLYIVIPKSRS